jgi:hypothetical protein
VSGAAFRSVMPEVMPDMRAEDVAFLDNEENWRKPGPSFDLFLWVPKDCSKEEIKKAFLMDGRVFLWDAATRRRFGGAAKPSFLDRPGLDGPYVLSSPREFPAAVGVGHSYVSRDYYPYASYDFSIPSWHMERACGTDCLNEDDLGNPERMLAFHALLISLARSVRTRVPILSAMIRGEVWWTLPMDNDRPRVVADGNILVRKDIARLSSWESVEVDEHWVGVPLLCPSGDTASKAS